jgi:hypothetical protein
MESAKCLGAGKWFGLGSVYLERSFLWGFLRTSCDCVHCTPYEVDISVLVGFVRAMSWRISEKSFLQ